MGVFHDLNFVTRASELFHGASHTLALTDGLPLWVFSKPCRCHCGKRCLHMAPDPNQISHNQGHPTPEWAPQCVVSNVNNRNTGRTLVSGGRGEGGGGQRPSRARPPAALDSGRPAGHRTQFQVFCHFPPRSHRQDSHTEPHSQPTLRRTCSGSHTSLPRPRKYTAPRPLDGNRQQAEQELRPRDEGRLRWVSKRCLSGFMFPRHQLRGVSPGASGQSCPQSSARGCAGLGIDTR